VRVVFKNLVVHPQVVTRAHLAGCAAAKQGKFVAYKNAFWDKAFGPYKASQGKDHSGFSDEGILKIASEIGLDTAKLKADMDSDECKQRLEQDAGELAKFKVNSTPSFFINGQHVGGALPIDAFKQVIDEKLKVAEASGVAGAEYYDKEIMAKGEKQFRSKMDPKPQ
jgi:protein-disulfide isomerase